MSSRKKYKTPESQLSLLDFDHPVMPVFDKSRCEARLINYETAARMVETYHYAHRVPSIVVAVGMFVDGVLAGVCTYGIPPVPNVQRLCGEEYRQNALELNRLFIFDWAGRNSESWLIGQSFNLIPKDYFILVSYADTKHNHIGKIYQATNWIYTGKTEPNDDVKLNGNYHPRATQHNGGSHAIIESGLGIIESRSLKYRYVYFLGNKRQRKQLRQALKWPILPYPKEA